MERNLNKSTLLAGLLLMVSPWTIHADDTETLSFPPENANVSQAPIFSAPVPVLDTTGAAHSGDLLFALFQPSTRPLWRGNIKRYRLGRQPAPSGDVLALYDADGNLALDADTGLFNRDTTSMWTPEWFSPDGGNIAIGGLASRLFAYQGEHWDRASANHHPQLHRLAAAEIY